MNTISPQSLSCCSLRRQLSTKHEKWMWHTESIDASHRWEEGVWGSEVTGGMSPVWRYCTSKRPAALIKAVSGSQTHGSRPLGLFCQYFFSRQFLLFSNFPFLSRLSCWLLTSKLVSCLFLHCSCLPGLSLCLVYDFSLFLIISLTRSWIRPSCSSMWEINWHPSLTALSTVFQSSLDYSSYTELFLPYEIL